MDVKPNYCSMESLFADSAIYKVPKYQRAYSWYDKNIEQFTSDIAALWSSFEDGGADDGNECTHFFGGIVCVKIKNKDSLDDKAVYLLVDGQQRLSTTVLLISRLIEYIKELKLDEHYSGIRERRIEKYRNGFIHFTTEENDKLISYPRISLSKRDYEFYDKLITGGEFTIAEIESHDLLIKAAKKIDAWLKSLFPSSLSPSDKLTQADHLYKVVSKFCKILVIRMSDVNDAYKLFQVINDRGRSLTASDLLRASSLGAIDSIGVDDDTIHELEAVWDGITSQSSKSTDDKLIAYYTSKIGKSCKKTSLFETFNNSFFSDPENVTSEIKSLQMGIDVYDKLKSGVWPYDKSKLTGFQKRKLYNLVVTFKHTHCIPLLMAATQLPEKKFYQIVFFLERFFFIFRVALEKRMTGVTKLYHSSILSINKQPSTYQVKYLISELQAIFKRNVTALDIENYILKLNYIPGGDNRHIKYILSSIEESWKYLELNKRHAVTMYRHAFKGLTDDYFVFTIEHIYPRNAKVENVDPSLEEVKNSISNLAILYGQDNESFTNLSFSEKRKEYAKSRLNSTIVLSKLNSWNVDCLNSRKERLLDDIVNVFGLGVELGKLNKNKSGSLLALSNSDKSVVEPVVS
ncbi:DUF262 domain-containing HNH endonuclease family protein [Oceanimonas pelagia]|uniref:DUF262 domain-containing HNH endonuclease family protein n=1 Tax=Oceanimonas pelagia TaxID=3028314 RepID=A0AA50QB76_9GAMM|nr:DUF262 domain-containing HNH endonuclease family protein [Oceanimonas pelagia]WMC09821.1 DUF262 domain-containing HNH endonuclease family protein [Oceanimonas pelagia]